MIRLKVVQLTYSFYQNEGKSLDVAEKELNFSMSKAYELYLYLLSLLVEIQKYAARRNEQRLAREQRSGAVSNNSILPAALGNSSKLDCTHLHGNSTDQILAGNKLLLLLRSNKALNEYIENQKAAWDEEENLVKRLYSDFIDSDIFGLYVDKADYSFASDRELIRKFYKTYICDNEDIDSMLEDHSLYWNDDKEIIDSFVLKTIKRFDEKSGSKQELLPEYDNEEDKDYARRLFCASILNANEYQRIMSDASRNWDFARLAYMDVVIMQIAIAEMLTFPGIPAQVTINEFVELAKLYSTPRSSSYVNGMLDSIARYLISTGKMMKEMPEPRNRQQDRQANGDGASTGRVRFVHRPKTNEEPKAPEAAGTDSATTDPADANEAHNANGAAQD